MQFKLCLFLVFLIFMSINSIWGQSKFGDWKESDISLLDYRLAYKKHNTYAASKEKPAHVWILQIRNRDNVEREVSWCVGDSGSVMEEIPDRRIRCFEPGEIRTSDLHHTNTPANGLVQVHFRRKNVCDK